METKCRNKLIAEFMGARVEQSYPKNEKEGQDGLMFYFNKENVPAGLYMSYSSAGLKYHSSWDWLMPVVEKINKEGKYRVRIFFDANGTNSIYNCYVDKVKWENSFLMDDRICGRSDIEDSILVVWKTIVEFIQLYNQNNKENG